MTKQVKVISICLFLGIIFGVAPLAAGEQELFFQSIRQQSMGGARVAITYDEHALYTNPAGLAKAQTSLRLPRVMVGINSELIDNSAVLQDIANELTPESERFNLISGLVPMPVYVDIGVSPVLSFITKDFGIGVFTQGQIQGSLKRRTNPLLEVSGGIDAAGFLSLAREYDIYSQPVTLGISARYLMRGKLYDPETGAETFKQPFVEMVNMINNGEELSINGFMTSGFGLDLGCLTPVDTPIGNGNVGLVLNNVVGEISGTKEVNDVEQDFSSTLPMTGTIGIGVQTRLPKFAWVFEDWMGDFLLAADYKFISPHSSFFKNLFIGIEKNVFYDRLTLRGGVHQGYLCGGVGLDLYILHLDYAYYVNEMGSEITMDPVASHILELRILL